MSDKSDFQKVRQFLRQHLEGDLTLGDGDLAPLTEFPDYGEDRYAIERGSANEITQEARPAAFVALPITQGVSSILGAVSQQHPAIDTRLST